MVGKPHTRRSDPVDVGGLITLLAVTGKIAVTRVIKQDVDYIGALRRRQRAPRTRGKTYGSGARPFYEIAPFYALSTHFSPPLSLARQEHENSFLIVSPRNRPGKERRAFTAIFLHDMNIVRNLVLKTEKKDEDHA
jgi:hypothetical protein